ncbi:hypothetical protein GCM10009839_80210 [Catenulispora yoronensis]|uniref:DUF4253 domain-containing protein n=1 Tax=Catenulispora yoronensis TaxID=450799 RepID=A0ABP5GYP2_9ACTN
MKDLIGTAVVKCTLADGTDISVVPVEPGTAPEVWRTLRDQHATTGLWPFLVDSGDPGFLDRLPLSGGEREYREYHRGAAEIFAEFFGRAGTGREEPVAEEPAVDRASAVAGTTAIALVAAEWGGVEIPGLLDWDGAPSLSGLEHTAVLADWHRRFGAELMTLTGDRIELSVPRPPVEVKEVAAVGMEQAGYCPGVEQGQASGWLWCFGWGGGTVGSGYGSG